MSGLWERAAGFEKGEVRSGDGEASCMRQRRARRPITTLAPEKQATCRDRRLQREVRGREEAERAAAPRSHACGESVLRYTSSGHVEHIAKSFWGRHSPTKAIDALFSLKLGFFFFTCDIVSTYGQNSNKTFKVLFFQMR